MFKYESVYNPSRCPCYFVASLGAQSVACRVCFDWLAKFTQSFVLSIIRVAAWIRVAESDHEVISRFVDPEVMDDDLHLLSGVEPAAIA